MMDQGTSGRDSGRASVVPDEAVSFGPRRVCRDDRSLRPDLAGTMLELPAGQWWADDGWLRMEVFQVGDPTQPGLPDGWIWVVGELHLDGGPVDWCTVPVRVDALPAPEAAGDAN